MLMNPHEIYATNGWGQITVEMKIRGKKIKVMLDSGATGNYISPSTVGRLNIPITSIVPYTLQLVDGTNTNHNEGVVDRATIPFKLSSPDRHKANVQFDISDIGDHEAILGMPWFREHNPEID
jgi:hypothetical protein